jgi:hypothetical protein
MMNDPGFKVFFQKSLFSWWWIEPARLGFRDLGLSLIPMLWHPVVGQNPTKER